MISATRPVTPLADYRDWKPLGQIALQRLRGCAAKEDAKESDPGTRPDPDTACARHMADEVLVLRLAATFVLLSSIERCFRKRCITIVENVAPEELQRMSDLFVACFLPPGLEFSDGPNAAAVKPGEPLLLRLELTQDPNDWSGEFRFLQKFENAVANGSPVTVFLPTGVSDLLLLSMARSGGVRIDFPVLRKAVIRKALAHEASLAAAQAPAGLCTAAG